jgi:hypothetical protein
MSPDLRAMPEPDIKVEQAICELIAASLTHRLEHAQVTHSPDKVVEIASLAMWQGIDCI